MIFVRRRVAVDRVFFTLGEMMENVYKNCCFVLFACMLAGLLLAATSSSYGQEASFAVAQRIKSAAGEGTCFAVAKTDTLVELWTAAHCTDGLGSTSTIVWQDGSQTTAVVAAHKDCGRFDVAKLIGKAPNETVHVLDVHLGDYGGDRWAYHAGFGIKGVKSLREITKVASSAKSRIPYFPSAEPGDSGGPVVNSRGKVIGVTVRKTRNGRFSVLLMDPISDWVSLKAPSLESVAEKIDSMVGRED